MAAHVEDAVIRLAASGLQDLDDLRLWPEFEESIRLLCREGYLELVTDKKGTVRVHIHRSFHRPGDDAVTA